QALLARLDNRLKTLTGGAYDIPTRQQTLRGVIDWSYTLLTIAERRLFTRLSVFVGGWTLEAAEQICDDGQGDFLELLSALIDHSLVCQESVEDGQESRLSMLETMR